MPKDNQGCEDSLHAALSMWEQLLDLSSASDSPADLGGQHCQTIPATGATTSCCTYNHTVGDVLAFTRA